MLKTVLLLCLSLSLSGCIRDETLSGYAPGIWHLAQSSPGIGLQATPAFALDLTARGRISGRGPCNVFSAPQAAPYPWFTPGPFVSSLETCPDLATEQIFLSTLSRMSLAEVSGPVLILSNDAGETLLFRLAGS